MEPSSLQASVQNSDGTLLIKGVLDISTVGEILSVSQAWLEKTTSNEVRVDLNEVMQAESASISLLLSLMRLAKQAQKRIVFLNIPEKVLAIASVSGLDALLPLGRQK